MLDECVSEFKRHALECFPEECCGYIFNDKYTRLRNNSPTPNVAVECELPDDYDYFCHSHTRGPLEFSSTDLEYLRREGKPFMLVVAYTKQTTEVLIEGK